MASQSIHPVAAVNGAVFDERGRLLLTRRSPHIRAPGRWCLPGGHVEIGESWEQAMVREMQEETGLTPLSYRLIGLYADPKLTITEATADGMREQFLGALFLVERFSGAVAPNDEVDLWGWFTPEDLPSPFLSSHPPRVADAFARPKEVVWR